MSVRQAGQQRLSPSMLVARREHLHLIDIREPHEWAEGHIEDSRHIPMDVLLRDPDLLPAGRPVTLVCRSGSRSLFAAQQLSARGVEVTDLEGGLVAWAAEGLPLVTG